MRCVDAAADRLQRRSPIIGRHTCRQHDGSRRVGNVDETNEAVAKGKDCLVRINGEDVVEYHELENLDPGRIMLQAHQNGRWIEYKQIRIKPL